MVEKTACFGSLPACLLSSLSSFQSTSALLISCLEDISVIDTIENLHDLELPYLQAPRTADGRGVDIRLVKHTSFSTSQWEAA